MRNVEEIHNDIRKTKRGLRNARRKKEQCEQKLKDLEAELKEVEKHGQMDTMQREAAGKCKTQRRFLSEIPIEN